jgi:hypothetical protein
VIRLMGFVFEENYEVNLRSIEFLGFGFEI